MIRSMTGYGRGINVAENMTVTVEIKSVNHRYFEFTPKVYRGYAFIEEKLKAPVRKRMSRGKIDCFVSIESDEYDGSVVDVNHPLAKSFLAAIDELCGEYSLTRGDDVSILTAHPEIFSIKKVAKNEDEIWAAVQPALDAALDAFVAMREREGEEMKNDVLARADVIAKAVEFIEKRSPETVNEYTEKLRARLQEVLQDRTVDEGRLLQEAAIYADKTAVAEETVRLRSHLQQLHNMLNSDEPIGRNLDFLVQEMNREANTIGSKAQNIEIARKVIIIKGEIEKIREQIQNIE